MWLRCNHPPNQHLGVRPAQHCITSTQCPLSALLFSVRALSGYNQWGELGLGDNDDRGDEPNEMGINLDFVNLGDDARVVSLALGDWHT